MIEIILNLEDLSCLTKENRSYNKLSELKMKLLHANRLKRKENFRKNSLFVKVKK
jgi:hypothetical protein